MWMRGLMTSSSGLSEEVESDADSAIFAGERDRPVIKIGRKQVHPALGRFEQANRHLHASTEFVRCQPELNPPADVVAAGAEAVG
jgi:hypothetical protein